MKVGYYQGKHVIDFSQSERLEIITTIIIFFFVG